MFAAPHLIVLADCVVDTSQQIIVRPNRREHLTTREHELLCYLAEHPGRTITREELLERVWGYPRHASSEPVYSTVKRLRAKIEGPSPHRHVVTVHGEGYRFEPPPAPPGPALGGATPPAPTAAPDARAARTRFVGREVEIAAARRRLDEGARLVTVLGPGGVGKTRVACELARRVRGEGRAVVFCDLSAATTPGAVLRAIAGALDLPLDGDDPGSWARGIGRALANRPALLILDNVEQVLSGAAAALHDWLDLAQLLVTSREPLRVVGESIVELGPLPPDEAVELFLDRARAAGAAPDLGAEGAATIRAVVDRLDRLPLAIELAAARTRLLSPAALLERLTHQLDALSQDALGVPPRHTTLRACVAWSWDLLSPEERAALSQCSVFAGGFTAEAAAAIVAIGAEGDGRGAFDLLGRLRDRSLIRPREVPDLPGQARFELYAAVKQLARERLEDPAGACARHAAWALDEGERWLGDLDRGGHPRAQAHLEAEVDNLRAAFDYACVAAPSTAARLAVVLDAALRLRGGGAVRRSILEAALPLATSASERGRIDLALGELAEQRGGRGEAHLEAALAAAQGGGLATLEAAAEARLGEVLASRGDVSGGVERLTRARDLAAAAGDRWLEGRAYAGLGEVWWRAGEVPEARAALEVALTIHREVGDLRGSARTSATLCHVLRADGRWVEAMAMLDAAERELACLRDPVGQARLLVDRGLHLSRVGRGRDACAVLVAAQEAFARLGLLRGSEEVHLHLAEALLGLGEDARAVQELSRAVATCRELGEQMRLSIALELLACAALLRGDLGGAERALDEALSIARAAGNGRSEATILAKCGLCHLLRSRWEAALVDFIASEALHHNRGALGMEGTVAADRGVALSALGRVDAARAAHAHARELLGDPPDTVWTGRMLTLLEAASEALHQIGLGTPRAEVEGQARALRDRILIHMPPDAQDLATRLSCLLLDHALGACRE